MEGKGGNLKELPKLPELPKSPKLKSKTKNLPRICADERG